MDIPTSIEIHTAMEASPLVVFPKVKVNGRKRCSVSIVNSELLAVYRPDGGYDHDYKLKDIVDIDYRKKSKLKIKIAFKPAFMPPVVALTQFLRKGLVILTIKLANKSELNKLIEQFFIADIFTMDVITAVDVARTFFLTGNYAKLKELPPLRKWTQREEDSLPEDLLEGWKDFKY